MNCHTLLKFTPWMLAVVLWSCADVPPGKYPTEDALAPGVMLEPDTQLERQLGAPLRPIPAQGLRLTKSSEGWRPSLYNDVAHYCSIGYGHLIKRLPCDGTEPEEFRSGLSELSGSELLKTDLARAEAAIAHLVRPELNDEQYSALCDFVFNVGSTNFSKSTLLVVLNQSQFDRVPQELVRWVLANGKEWPGLRRRRQLEAEIFSGVSFSDRGLDQVLAPIDIRTGENISR